MELWLITTPYLNGIYVDTSEIDISFGRRPKPTPARIASSIPARDTGYDLHWGWFGSGTETVYVLIGNT